MTCTFTFYAFLPSVKANGASQSHSHTDVGCAVECWRQPMVTMGNVGVQYLAQGYFDTWAGKTGIEPAMFQSEFDFPTDAPALNKIYKMNSHNLIWSFCYGHSADTTEEAALQKMLSNTMYIVLL